MKVIGVTIIIGMVIILGLVRVAAADETYWTDLGTDDWFDTNNWSNGVPDENAFPVLNAYINNGGTAEIDSATPIASTPYLYLGENYGESGNVNLKTGTLDVGLMANIGYGGNGVITQTGGLADFYDMRLGLFMNGDGAYYLSGGTLDVNVDLLVGNSGVGLLEIDGDGAPTLAIGGWLRVGTGTGTGSVRITGNAGSITTSIGDFDYGVLGGWDTFDITSLLDVNISGSWTNRSPDPSSGDFTTTRLNFAGPSATFEVAGNPGTGSGFGENFALYGVTVADGSQLQLEDSYDNDGTVGNDESLWLQDLSISGTGTLDLTNHTIYWDGDHEAEGDAMIADGRIYDSTPGTFLDARTFSVGGQTITAVSAVPEPATLLLLGSGLAGLASLRHRRNRH